MGPLPKSPPPPIMLRRAYLFQRLSYLPLSTFPSPWTAGPGGCTWSEFGLPRSLGSSNTLFPERSDHVSESQNHNFQGHELKNHSNVFLGKSNPKWMNRWQIAVHFHFQIRQISDGNLHAPGLPRERRFWAGGYTNLEVRKSKNSMGAQRNFWLALGVPLHFESLNFWAGFGINFGPQTKYLGAPHQKKSGVQGWGLPNGLTWGVGNMK